MSFFQQLFARKSIETLMEEMHGDNRLRRVLGPINLTALGIGAIIGAGIFVMTGRVAAVDAGPAVMVSYIVAGIGCVLAALCYSEFASTVPVAGSAYTYAYATLGELLAWIIGWDLILEYAMACSVVASAWGEYLNEFLKAAFGKGIWKELSNAPFAANNPANPFEFTLTGDWCNLPAFVIMVLVTIILVVGIRESATTNAVLVGIKVGVVLFVIGIGIFFVKSINWNGQSEHDRISPQEAHLPKVVGQYVKDTEKLSEEEAKKRTEKLVEYTRARLRIDQKTLAMEKLQADGKIDAEKAKAEIAKTTEENEAGLPSKDAENTADRLLVYRLSQRARLHHLLESLSGEVRNHVTREESLKGKEADERFNTLHKEAFKAYLLPQETKLFEDLTKNEALSKEDADLGIENVRKDLAADTSNSEKDRKLISALIEKAETAKQPPDEKWGLLGVLGVDKQLGPLDDSVRSPFAPYGLSGIMLGAALVFFAYIGFDSISTHSEEAKRPQRDVPIGILASLLICTVLYILVSAVITGMEPYYKIDQKAAVAAAFRHQSETRGDDVLLRAAGVLIAVGGLAGMTSVLLITFLSQARIFLAMARDGLLPPSIFGVVHEKFKTPHISTILTGSVICVVAALTPISVLETMVSIGTLLAFVIVCGAVLGLRILRPDVHRPFRTPFIWIVAPLGVLVNLLMMLFLPPGTWLRLLVWLVLGLVIYFAYGMRKSALARSASK